MFELIIPIAKADLDIAKKSLPHIKKCLKPSKIIIIANEQIRNEVCGLGVDFSDENTLFDGLNFSSVREYLDKRGAAARTGWYFQQFLKMAYAYKCEKPYYLTWDADTVPIRDICFFDGKEIPAFSMKREYNKAYFDTIEKLFGLKKAVKKSFIAEHMMFSCEIMQEMIDKIQEINAERPWWQIILDCIDDKDISNSGFSEFETFGTYVLAYHRDKYRRRNVKAVRNGKIIFGDYPSEDVISWLARRYMTVSFEKTQSKNDSFDAWESAKFRKIFSAELYVNFLRVVMKIKK